MLDHFDIDSRRRAPPTVGIGDLPDDVRLATPGRGGPGGPTLTLAEVERQHIPAVVDAAEGNRTRAAALLGIEPATLVRKLRLYGKRV